MKFENLCRFLLTILVAFYCFESTQGSKVSGKHDESKGKAKKNPMKRVSKADGVSSNSTTKGGFHVIEYHHAIVESIGVIIRKMANGIRTVVRFTKQQYKRTIDTILLWTINVLQSIQNRLKQSVYENEPITEVPTMSSIYDSVSSVMSSSQDPTVATSSGTTAEKKKQPLKASTTPTNNDAQKKTAKPATTTTTTTTTTPSALRSGKNLPKATSTASLKKKSTIGVGGKKSAFDFSTTQHAARLDDDDNITVPATSYLGSLFPTLVTGLVFATAGSMVGFLWNGDWTEAASAVAGYFWSDEASDDTTTTTGGETQQQDAFASTAAPITPEKY